MNAILDVYRTENKQLRAENDTLVERVRQLEEQLVPPAPLPAHWPRLTAIEEKLVRAMAVFRLTTYDFLHTRLYGHLNAPPDIAILKVLVCKIRQKLAPVGVKIETDWGRGYMLDEATRRLLKTEKAGERQEVTR